MEDAAAAEKLRTFLLAQFKPGDSILDFLKKASSQELREHLFHPFQWITEEPDIDLVKRDIERRLIRYGEGQGISPSLSIKTLDSLLAYCLSIAQKGSPQERSLAREDFARVFSDKTSIPVPQTMAHLAKVAQMLALSDASSSGLIIQSAWSVLRNEPPPLPSPALHRTALISKLAAKLSPDAPVLIVGSIGKGKTTVAQLIAELFQDQCVWVELTGRGEVYVEQVLNMLTIEVGDRHTAKLVVIDDLDVGAGLPQSVWSALELLNRACRQTGRYLLITAQGIPEDRVDGRLKLLGTIISPIPDLSIEEIEELFSSLGCPNDTRLNQWARLTELHTSGNPKLVHLRGLELKDEGWPTVSADNLLQTPHSIESQRIQQRLDVSKKLTGSELEFLYLLTLVGLPFNRTFALALGGKVHGLMAPGDCFDRFAGRWLDNVGKDRYKITSLLSGQAKQAWAADMIIKAHGLIFDAYASLQTMNVQEAFSVLIHAMASEDGGRVGGVASSIITTKATIFAQLAKNLLTVVRLGKGIGTWIFPKDKKASLMLRALQFKIADREAPEEAERIASEWDWEISQLPNGELKDGSRLIYVLCILVSQSETVPAAETIKCLVALDRLQQVHPYLRGELSNTSEPMLAETGTTDLITLLFSFVQLRCRDIESLSEILDALTGISDQLRNRMLAAFDLPACAGYGFILSVWSLESKKNNPDWHRVEDVLLKAWHLAADKWNNRTLGVKAAKALSVVIDEHLKDRNRAELVISEAKQKFPSSPILDEQLANIRFQHDDFSGALDIWSTTLALDSNDPKGRVSDPYTFRRAGIAAAKIGQFAEAATWFMTGAEWARRASLDAKTGLYFDAAFCAFKGGAWSQMQSALIEALPGIMGTPNPDDDFRSFALQKIAGHTLLWMLNQVTGVEFDDYDEPVLGICSSPEYHVGIKELPRSPFVFTVTHAIELEHALGLDPIILQSFAPTLTVSKVPGVRIKLAKIQIGQAFRTLDFYCLPETIWDMQQAYWQGIAQHRSGRNLLESFEGEVDSSEVLPKLSAECFLLCAISLHKLSGKDEAQLFKTWRNRVASFPNQQFFDDPLRLIEQGIARPIHQARDIMRNATGGWIECASAAVAVLTAPLRAPEDTAYAQIALLLWLSNTVAQDAAIAAISTFSAIFAKAWRTHIEMPALLRNPRLTIPDLWRVVNDSDDGPRKLKELFRAATSATGVRAPEQIYQWLGDIVNKNGRYQRP